jgi:hypothetical protein
MSLTKNFNTGFLSSSAITLGNLFTTSANVGIGTTSPGYTLDVNGTGRINTRLDIGGTQPSFSSSTIGQLFLTGVINSNNGPHIMISTSQDQYPVYHQLNYSHDNIGFSFDSYYDGSWRTSTTNTAFQLYKISNQLQFNYVTGSAGSAKTFTNAMVVGSSGNIGIGTASPGYTLDLSGTSRIVNTNSTSMGTLIVAGPGSSSYLPATTTSGQLASFYGPGGGNTICNIDLSTFLPQASTNNLPTTRISMSDLGSTNSTFNILTKNSGSTGTMASRIMIDGSGNVGINTTSPTVTLDVNGNSKITNATVSNLNVTNLNVSNATFGNIYLTGSIIGSSGYSIGLGTDFRVTSPNANWFEYNGTAIGIFYQGSGYIPTPPNYITNSDYRIKENFKEIKNPLELLNKIRTYEFNFKNTSVKTQGFIAHEIQEILPFSVYGKKDDVDDEGNMILQRMDYSLVVPLLTESIKEILIKNQQLEDRIKILETKNKKSFMSKIFKKFTN